MTYTLREIADRVGGEVVGNDQITIKAINSLEAASEGDISFFYDPRYKTKVIETKASALIVAGAVDFFGGAQLVVSNPALAYARVADLFVPKGTSFSGISPQAVIHENARIGLDVTIHPLVYVGEGAGLGDHVTIYPGVFIGDGVSIGDHTVVYPNVTIMSRCTIGRHVIIHGGTVIGSDGFGFVKDGHENVKIPQMGTVQIDDHVEIGASNCIDRAALGKTWIQRGVKTDNLVQIGHNVVIGENTIVVSQAAMGGSVRIGRDVVIGGQVAVSDHVSIADRAMIGSQSGVPKSIKEGEVVSGTPAMPHKLWLKTSRLIPRLPTLYDRLRALEKKLDALSDRIDEKP